MGVGRLPALARVFVLDRRQLDSVLEQRVLQHQVEAARAQRAQLPKHYLRAHAAHVVLLGEHGRLHEDVDRLLERAAHERPRFLLANAVAADGHQVPFVGHHVA